MKVNLQKIKEILERGVEQIVEKKSLIKKLTSGRKLRIKLGIDPTSPILHLGNAIPLWKLRQFQDLGHQIILIIGDFTAQIGDTSDKMAMRQPLSSEQIEENMKDYKKQISKILDLTKTKIVYNSTWLSKLRFEEILKLARQFTVAQMLERENFDKRYKTGKPINLQEILYPLMQGYDSVAIQADVEIGGTDQTFNLLAGRAIQKAYGQKPQDIITLTLIEGTDGRKMSKSFGNIIAIIDEPVDMFGKVMSMDDDLIVKYFRLCTLLPLNEIEKIEKGLNSKKINPREAKIKLAREIVAVYHGQELAKEAEEEFNRVFKKKELPSRIPEVRLQEKTFPILDLLVKTNLASSKSEAKRLILQRGVKINGRVQEDWKGIIKAKKKMIIQVGKRKFVKIT
jgi:tyrosyl-tRNA synthetase